MKFLSALEQAQWHVRTLWKVVIVAFAINTMVLLGWMHAQAKIQIEIPPAVPESGLTLTEGQVPDTTIYSFAFYIWQSINHWPNDGMQDYKNQLSQFTPFLTPGFKIKLANNYNQLLNEGELQDRVRLMQGVAGSEYQPGDVKYLGHGTWIVFLDMQLTEMMNANAKIVKDVNMQYALTVVRFNVDAKTNPWGLALAGFAESPMRTETHV